MSTRSYFFGSYRPGQMRKQRGPSSPLVSGSGTVILEAKAKVNHQSFGGGSLPAIAHPNLITSAVEPCRISRFSVISGIIVRIVKNRSIFCCAKFMSYLLPRRNDSRNWSSEWGKRAVLREEEIGTLFGGFLPVRAFKCGWCLTHCRSSLIRSSTSFGFSFSSFVARSRRADVSGRTLITIVSARASDAPSGLFSFRVGRIVAM